MSIQELEDRILLRELVDNVSILGDQKDFNAQLNLFAEDALSETFAEGALVLEVKGREEMAKAFSKFLKEYETVYHFNGQHVVTYNGDEASGTCYCFITLISSENGKKVKTYIGAVYHDEYIRQDGRWLIAKRIGNFEWQEKMLLTNRKI
ncbi:nuclear transport factor 2 family protein [Mucilaginibacter lutimaris]|uniref:Nuclear transport factor 2 family protein n=1 Tax=Mucilaginibacter lutimaris TaxID=931629 RepID=A0ABW2ZB89_9SPHI